MVDEGSTMQPSRISASQPTRIIGFEEFIEAASKAALRALDARNGGPISVTIGVWFTSSGEVKQQRVGHLLIAYPTSNTELRLVFSEPVDRASAERVESYTTESGLRILYASVDTKDPKRVTLNTERMNGEAMKVDVVKAIGVRTASGAALAQQESPRFIHGIASILEIQKPAEEAYPFRSRYEGLVATASCQKDGGADSHVLINDLGYSFLHREIGGPFNSLKVTVGIGQKQIPGITEEVERLAPLGLSPHVLWSGGEIRNVNGETQLVDTGFIEGSIMEATPKKFPPPYPIKTRDITGEASSTLRAKSLQGVIVGFENVVVDSISAPNERKLRSFVFHDDSGAQADGLLLHTVTREIEPGQKFQFMRGLVDHTGPAQYRVIVELDPHLTPSIA